MSSYTLTSIVPLPDSTLDVINNKEIDGNPSAVFSSDLKLAWITHGPHLEVVDSKTGAKVSEYTFGAVAKEHRAKIVCVKELNTPFRDVTLLIVGLEFEGSKGLVCVFDILTQRVLRAIEIPHKVSMLHVITNGKEPTTLPGPLSCFDGVLAVGTVGGEIFIVDICRELVDEARSIYPPSFLNDELNPCVLRVILPPKIEFIERYNEKAGREGKHLAIHLNAITDNDTPHFVLKSPTGKVIYNVNKEETVVSSLQYAPQLCSVFVGFNFGAFQLWNLLKMCINYTSPIMSGNVPVSHFAIQEPADDPKPFCYFWVVYSDGETYSKRFPTAEMSVLIYESKDWHEGYGYIYQNFDKCAVRFRADLQIVSQQSSEEEPVGAQCIRLQSLSKEASRDINSSFADSSEDSCILCLMVWNILYKDWSVRTYLSLFDLNQWYKEQMPSFADVRRYFTYMTHVPLSEVIHLNTENQVPLLDVCINPASISQFIGTQRLEEHYYPSSLSFDCCALNEQEVYSLKNYGLQRQLYRDLEIVGPLALMKPHDLFANSVKLGLTPLYMEPLHASLITVNTQREHLLSMALERRMKTFLFNCAESWANGSHTVAGLSLDFLLNWAWQRANVIKNNTDRLCVSLFDYSEERLDPNANNLLSKCRGQILVLRDLYGYICKKCAQFLLVPDVTFMQWECLKRIYVYLDVIGWMINVGLLPEIPVARSLLSSNIDRMLLPYSYNMLKRFYDDRKSQLKLLNNRSEFDVNAVFYIEKLLESDEKKLIQREWRSGDNSGHYPPPSLQSLLRIYLLDHLELEHKHSVVAYFLLDLTMLLQDDRYKAVIPTLVKFPNIFQLSVSSTKIVQAFWHLDHGQLKISMDYLLDPMIKSTDLEPWHHRLVLETLILQKQYREALHYYKVRQLQHDNLEDVALIISLFIYNRMLLEAIDMQRKYARENDTTLLCNIFKICLKTDQLKALIDIKLYREEEDALIEFLQTTTKYEKDYFMTVYYLRRGRQFDLNMCLAGKRGYGSRCSIDEGSVQQIISNFNGMLPAVSQDVIRTCLEEKDNLFSKDSLPNPMSVFLHNKNERAKYKSNFVYACLAKSHEVWNGPENPKKRFIGEDFPFLRSTFVSENVGRTRMDLICPKIVRTLARSDLEDENAGATPPKRLKLSGRESVQRMSIEENDKLLELTRIETPLVKRKTPVKYSPSNRDVDVATPHSILKTRRAIRDSTTPETCSQRSTTPELEDIQKPQAPSNTRDSFVNLYESPKRSLVTPRKSLLRTSIVRFTDVTPSSASTSKTDLESSDLHNKLNPLASVSCTTINSKNSSASNDEFYSPEITLEPEEKETAEVEDHLHETKLYPKLGESLLKTFSTADESISDNVRYGGKNFPSSGVCASDILSIPRKICPRKSIKSLSSKTRSSEENESEKEEIPQVDNEVHKQKQFVLTPRKSLSNKISESNSKNSFIENRSVTNLTIENSYFEVETVKRITQNSLEESVSKLKSTDIVNRTQIDNTETVTKEYHESSSKTVKKLSEQTYDVTPVIQVEEAMEVDEPVCEEEEDKVSEQVDSPEAVNEFCESSKEASNDEFEKGAIFLEQDIETDSELDQEEVDFSVLEDIQLPNVADEAFVDITDENSTVSSSTKPRSMEGNDGVEVISLSSGSDNSGEYDASSVDTLGIDEESSKDIDDLEEDERLEEEKEGSSEEELSVEREDEVFATEHQNLKEKDDENNENSRATTVRDHSRESNTVEERVELKVVAEELPNEREDEVFETEPQNLNKKDYENNENSRATTKEDHSSESNTVEERVEFKEVAEELEADKNIKSDEDEIKTNSETSKSIAKQSNELKLKKESAEEIAVNKSTSSILQNFEENKQISNSITIDENKIITEKESLRDMEELPRKSETNEEIVTNSIQEKDQCLEHTHIQQKSDVVEEALRGRTKEEELASCSSEMLEECKPNIINECRICEGSEGSENLVEAKDIIDDSRLLMYSSSSSSVNMLEYQKDIIDASRLQIVESSSDSSADAACKDIINLASFSPEPNKNQSITTSKISSPKKHLRRSLRSASVDSPTNTSIRSIRTRRSLSQASTQILDLSKVSEGSQVPASRRRSQSMVTDIENLDSTVKKKRGRPRKNTGRAEAESVSRKGKAASVNLPATKEDYIETYSSNRRVTRRQKDLLIKNLPHSSSTAKDEEDEEKLRLALLDKDEFQGEPDPDEQKVLDTSASSIADSQATSNTGSVVSKRQTRTSTKSKVTQRRMSADDVLTERVKKRRTSKDSSASEKSMSLRSSTRKRAKSETPESKSDLDVKATKQRKAKKSILPIIPEESSEKSTPKTRKKKNV